MKNGDKPKQHISTLGPYRSLILPPKKSRKQKPGRQKQQEMFAPSLNSFNDKKRKPSTVTSKLSLRVGLPVQKPTHAEQSSKYSSGGTSNQIGVQQKKQQQSSDYTSTLLLNAIDMHMKQQEVERHLSRTHLAASRQTLEQLCQTLCELWNAVALPQWERIHFVKQKINGQLAYENLVSSFLQEIKCLQKFRQLCRNVVAAIVHRENVRTLINSYIAEYLPDQFRGTFAAKGLMLPDLLVSLRDASLLVVEHIHAWRRVLQSPRGYAWKDSANYLIKMQTDMHFLFTDANIRWLQHRDVQRRIQPMDTTLMLHFPVATSRQFQRELFPVLHVESDAATDNINCSGSADIPSNVNTSSSVPVKEPLASQKMSGDLTNKISARDEVEYEKQRRCKRAIGILRRERAFDVIIKRVESMGRRSTGNGRPVVPTVDYEKLMKDNNGGIFAKEDEEDDDGYADEDDIFHQRTDQTSTHIKPKSLVVGCRGIVTNTNEYVCCVFTLFSTFDDEEKQQDISNTHWVDGFSLEVTVYRPCHQFNAMNTYWNPPGELLNFIHSDSDVIPSLPPLPSGITMRTQISLKSLLDFWEVDYSHFVSTMTRRFWSTALDRLFIEHCEHNQEPLEHVILTHQPSYEMIDKPEQELDEVEQSCVASNNNASSDTTTGAWHNMSLSSQNPIPKGSNVTKFDKNSASASSSPNISHPQKLPYFQIGFYKNVLRCQLQIRGLEFALHADIPEAHVTSLEGGPIDKALDAATTRALADRLYLRIVRCRRTRSSSTTLNHSVPQDKNNKDLPHTAKQMIIENTAKNSKLIIVEHLPCLSVQVLSVSLAQKSPSNPRNNNREIPHQEEKSSIDNTLGTLPLIVKKGQRQVCEAMYRVRVLWSKLDSDLVLDPKFEYEIQLCSQPSHPRTSNKHVQQNTDGSNNFGTHNRVSPLSSSDKKVVVLRRFFLHSVPSQRQICAATKASSSSLRIIDPIQKQESSEQESSEQKSNTQAMISTGITVMYTEHAPRSQTDVGLLEVSFTDPNEANKQNVSDNENDIESTLPLTSQKQHLMQHTIITEKKKLKRDALAARARERGAEERAIKERALHKKFAALQKGARRADAAQERKKRKLDQWMRRERRRNEQRKKLNEEKMAALKEREKKALAASRAVVKNKVSSNLGRVLSSRLIKLCCTDMANTNCVDHSTQQKVIEVLVDSGANPNVCDKAGIPVLTIASIRGRIALVEGLLKNGARMPGERRSRRRKKSHGIFTRKFGGPLFLAAGLGFADVVAILLESATVATQTAPNAHAAAPAVVNAKRSYDGMTPLAAAVSQGHAAVVRLLLAAGADPMIKLKHGMPILDLAATSVISRLLQEAEAGRAYNPEEIKLTTVLMKKKSQHLKTINNELRTFLNQLGTNYPPSRDPVRYISGYSLEEDHKDQHLDIHQLDHKQQSGLAHSDGKQQETAGKSTYQDQNDRKQAELENQGNYQNQNKENKDRIQFTAQQVDAEQEEVQEEGEDQGQKQEEEKQKQDDMQEQDHDQHSDWQDQDLEETQEADLEHDHSRGHNQDKDREQEAKEEQEQEQQEQACDNNTEGTNLVSSSGHVDQSMRERQESEKKEVLDAAGGDNNAFYIVMYDYIANDTDEMSILENAVLIGSPSDNEHWVNVKPFPLGNDEWKLTPASYIHCMSDAEILERFPDGLRATDQTPSILDTHDDILHQNVLSMNNKNTENHMVIEKDVGIINFDNDVAAPETIEHTTEHLAEEQSINQQSDDDYMSDEIMNNNDEQEEQEIEIADTVNPTESLNQNQNKEDVENVVLTRRPVDICMELFRSKAREVGKQILLEKRNYEKKKLENQIVNVYAQMNEIFETDDGDVVLDRQARLMWAKENNAFLTVTLKRNAPDEPLQATCTVPPTLDLTFGRVAQASPVISRVVMINSLKETSCLRRTSPPLDAGDVICAIDGEYFTSLAEFSALVKNPNKQECKLSIVQNLDAIPIAKEFKDQVKDTIYAHAENSAKTSFQTGTRYILRSEISVLIKKGSNGFKPTNQEQEETQHLQENMNEEVQSSELNNPAAVDKEALIITIQRIYRERRIAKLVKWSSKTVDGNFVFLEHPKVVEVITGLDTLIMETQARIAWSYENDMVRKVKIPRNTVLDVNGEPKLGLTAVMPHQLDLSMDTGILRVSDPFLVIENLTATSPLRTCGLREGEAIVGINGYEFDTLAKFADLIHSTPKTCNEIVLDVAAFETAPLTDQYQKRIKNAVLMRIWHEVDVRKRIKAHMPSTELSIAEKTRSLQRLRAFLEIQVEGTRRQNSFDEGTIVDAPILCAIVLAVEETGVLPNCSRPTMCRYAHPSTEQWLSVKLKEWRRKVERHGRPKKPSYIFMQAYQKFSSTYSSKSPTDTNEMEHEAKQKVNVVAAQDVVTKTTESVSPKSDGIGTEKGIKDKTSTLGDTDQEVTSKETGEGSCSSVDDVCWVQTVDASDGKVYYYNRATEETTWDKPSTGRIILEADLESQLTDTSAVDDNVLTLQPETVEDASKKAAEGSSSVDDVCWVQTVDASDGKVYYYNRATEETTWDKPSTGRIILEADLESQ